MASPPTTIAARKANDSASGKDSGARKPIGSVNSAPPTPAYAALIANVPVLKRARSTPIVRAAISLSRIATSARPTRPRTRKAASMNITAVTASVTKYSHWSSASPDHAGAATFSTLRPCVPPVSPSARLMICGVAIASPSVTSAR